MRRTAGTYRRESAETRQISPPDDRRGGATIGDMGSGAIGAGIGHGTSGLIVGYGLVLCGLYGGLFATRAPRLRFLAAPLFAVPVAIAAAICWSALISIVPRLPALLGPRLTPVCGGCVLLLSGFLAGSFAPRQHGAAILKRGARVVTVPPSRRWSGTTRSHPPLLFAGQAVPADDETKHFKLIGTTGTGKSTAIRGLLAGALARGDRAVIADPDGAYLARFHDSDRGDLILNPFDERSARWDLFGELREPYDGDQLARALIPDHVGEDRTWRGYARVFTGAVLRQLRRTGKLNVDTLHRLLTVAPVEELRELLGATAAAPFLTTDNARFFASVRAITTTHLAALEHLDRPNDAPLLSVRAWVRRVDGEARGILFLPYRASQIATLRNVVSTWMRLAIFESMELAEGDHRLWFIVDELDALGAIDGLKDALARLRKFGGRCVVGFQSIAQVSGTYGAGDAQTIVENCGNTLVLRCSASENGGTARFASKLIGEREVLRAQVSRSQSGFLEKPHRSKTTSMQHVTETAVLASEIEQLPDLAGYLKFASLPEWLTVTVPL
jgi:hypothetical protein